MEKNTDNFYLSRQEPNKSCLLALRKIILDMDAEVSETVKYGMPCFTYKNKMFAYLWQDKKTGEPYILFVEGKHLGHPELVTGDRARMKTFPVDPIKDIPIDTIRTLLDKALDLYRTGVIKVR